MTKRPELTPLTSSALSGFAYNADKRELHVQFASGKRWVYSEVPIEKAEALSGAASPGAYFGRKIRGIHKGHEIG